MKLEQGHVALTFEDRAANVLRTLEGDSGDVAGCARWFCANALRARKGLAEIAAICADPDVLRLVVEALEVQEDTK